MKNYTSNNKSVIISGFSQKLINGNRNPKNYPYWNKLIKMLKKEGYKTIQVGLKNEENLECDEDHRGSPLKNTMDLINSAYCFISVDNMIPHMVNYSNKNKKGVVIFGKSDPKIFGYKQNINLLKGKSFLRKNQFEVWNDEPYQESCFVEPEKVVEAVKLLND